MSAMTRALHDRFEEVCRLELVRLRRKTASLTLGQRAEVEAVSLEVTRAISAYFEASLDGQHTEGLDDIVGGIFGISPSDASTAGETAIPTT